MNDQANTPDTGNTPQGITPEVGKRYVERSGWITPPLKNNHSIDYPFIAGSMSIDIDGCYERKSVPHDFDLISEYVEPTVPTDTFRRDLIARLYCAMLTKEYDIAQGLPYGCMAHEAIHAADTLIEAMEGDRTSDSETTTTNKKG